MKRMFPRLFPVRAEDRLDEARMKMLADRFRRFDVRMLWVVVPLALALAGLSGWLVSPAEVAACVPEESLLADRSPVGSAMAAGMIVALTVGIGAAWLVPCVFLGSESRDYFRCNDTKSGYSGRKALLVLWLLITLMMGLCALALWRSDLRITSKGVYYKVGVTQVIHRDFSEIRTITLYRRLTAPIGVRDVPNLRVTFSTGRPFQTNADRKYPIEEMASILSRKSGVAIERADIRPQ